jgi:hypothetical protein
MANTRDDAASYVDQTIGRIREINERIIDTARQRGEDALETYSQLLGSVAEAQEAAGERTGDWVRAFAGAQAKFTRALADALPEAARSVIEQAGGLADKAAEQARRVPGVAQVEGEVRGAGAREQDLPIQNYDQLNVSEVIERLQGLSEPDLHKIDAYERKHANRKTLHEKIETLTSH